MNIQQKHLQIVGLILFVVAIKLYFQHRQDNYNGMFKKNGSYSTIGSTRHDVTKVFFVELFPFLILGLANDEPFFDSNNFLGSWVGKTAVIVTGYFIYHEVIQPYIVTRIPGNM
jgi:hypothetical protein